MKKLLVLISVLISITFLAGLIVMLNRSENNQVQKNTSGTTTLAHHDESGGIPDQSPWEIQKAQSLSQNIDGEFRVKGILITSKDLYVFYAERAVSGKLPDKITASSHVSGKTDLKPLAITTLQNLGKFANFNTGVVRIPLIDNPGQEISLQITLQGANKQTWEVTPIKQLTTIKEGITFFHVNNDSSTGNLKEVRLNGKNFLAILEFTSPDQVNKGESPIYLQIDLQGALKILNTQEVTTLTLPEGTVNPPFNSQDPTRATPAPVDPNPVN